MGPWKGRLVLEGHSGGYRIEPLGPDGVGIAAYSKINRATCL